MVVISGESLPDGHDWIVLEHDGQVVYLVRDLRSARTAQRVLKCQRMTEQLRALLQPENAVHLAYG